jgi:hypothetical protein
MGWESAFAVGGVNTLTPNTQVKIVKVLTGSGVNTPPRGFGNTQALNQVKGEVREEAC